MRHSIRTSVRTVAAVLLGGVLTAGGVTAAPAGAAAPAATAVAAGLTGPVIFT